MSPFIKIYYFTFNRDVALSQTRQANLLHLPKERTEAAKENIFIIQVAKFIIDFKIIFNFLI